MERERGRERERESGKSDDDDNISHGFCHCLIDNAFASKLFWSGLSR